MGAMRSFLILLLLALIGAGVYGYFNNPAACRKLGTDVTADLTTIFTPGSGTTPPAALPTSDKTPSVTGTADTTAQPKVWKQGFVTETDPQPAAPDTQPATPAPAAQPIALDTHQVYQDSDFSNFNDALDASRKRHRPVVILFTGSDWCPYCQSQESEVISTSQFEQYKDSHFVFVKVDDLRNSTMLDDEKERVKTLEAQYHIGLFPTLVVVDSNQKELGRVEGYNPGSGLAAVQSDLGKYLGN
jgi:thioredoxin-related protein